MKTEKLVLEVEMPNGVSAILSGKFLTVKGPKGEIKREVKQKLVDTKVDGNKIIFSSERNNRTNRKMAGSIAAHARNMVRGSQDPHLYTLKICSGHFPMTVAVQGNKFTVKNFLGEKVPRVLELKPNTEVKVSGDHITVTSASKDTAGQVSADIEQLMRRPGFDSRVFQDGIYLINKDGKELK